MINEVLGIVGILAGLTTIIVEILKQILPDSIPTKIVTIIVSFIITIVYTLVNIAITPTAIINAIAESFIVSYVAMYGFDSLKEIFNRFKQPKNESDNMHMTGTLQRIILENKLKIKALEYNGKWGEVDNENDLNCY